MNHLHSSVKMELSWLGSEFWLTYVTYIVKIDACVWNKHVPKIGFIVKIAQTLEGYKQYTLLHLFWTSLLPVTEIILNFASLIECFFVQKHSSSVPWNSKFLRTPHSNQSQALGQVDGLLTICCASQYLTCALHLIINNIFNSFTDKYFNVETIWYYHTI